MNSLYPSWRAWLLIFGGWTLFGFFFACQNLIFDAYSGRAVNLEQTLVSWLTCAYLWALLTPLVINLAQRFPFEKKSIRRNLSIHLAVCVVVSLFQLALYIVVWRLFSGGASNHPPLWESFKRLLISTGHENILIYWALLGLAHAANYYRRFREREKRAAQLELESAQLETQLTRAQLDALKMQLHPHFLFNTLNSISVLMQEDVAAANQMLVRLSDLLRLALKNNHAHEVPLKQELDFLRSYLEIEQTRFQDRLRVKIDADAETLDASVPNLILQPLVENCIRHAVAPKAAASTIEISAARRNGHLELVVRDDGAGLPASNGGAKGIGLANTRTRLEKLYGSNHQFELAPAKGGGLQVTISIPFQHAEIIDE
jgi:two-component system, LytTR family, sensor kinase